MSGSDQRAGHGGDISADAGTVGREFPAIEQHPHKPPNFPWETRREGLAAAKRTMATDKKAELVLAVYDLLEEPSVTKERVLKLVKLAA